METTDGHRWTQILTEKVSPPMGEPACRRKAFLSVFICVHLWFHLLFLSSDNLSLRFVRRTLQREPGMDFRSMLWRGADFQAARHQRGTLDHAQQAETGPR